MMEFINGIVKEMIGTSLTVSLGDFLNYADKSGVDCNLRNK